MPDWSETPLKVKPPKSDVFIAMFWDGLRAKASRFEFVLFLLSASTYFGLLKLRFRQIAVFWSETLLEAAKQGKTGQMNRPMSR